MFSISTHSQMTRIFLSPTYTPAPNGHFLLNNSKPLVLNVTQAELRAPTRPNLVLLHGSLSQRNHSSPSQSHGDYPDASTSKSPSPWSPSPADLPSLVFPKSPHFSLPPSRPIPSLGGHSCSLDDCRSLLTGCPHILSSSSQFILHKQPDTTVLMLIHPLLKSFPRLPTVFRA